MNFSVRSNNKVIIATVALFLAQLYLMFKGGSLFGKYWNPILLFTVSMAIPIVYLRWSRHLKNHLASKKSFVWTIAGISGMILLFPAIHGGLEKYPDPAQYSDVLPQLTTLYQRFENGIFPYALVPLKGYSPYPVYMPLHWLPVGIPYALHVDVRWVGYIMLALAIGFYGWLAGNGTRTFAVIIGAITPAVVLMAYLLSGEIDLPVTFEPIIAAYYVVLAAGILGRNIYVIAIGLIMCLVSRYTLIFWLPLFAVLLLREFKWAKNGIVWASVFLGIMALYVFPFLMKDTTILQQGVEYHNRCAIDEWTGYGNPPISYTFEAGIHFAQFFKNIFPGDMTHRVFYARIVQGALMILLNVAGLFWFFRMKDKVDPLEFSFVMLYVFLMFFYFFGPLTYRYYYITPLVFSAIMTGRIVAQNKSD